ncbi:type I phosphomannose isomerase catalytic subunit [Orenia marismortui]|uniref:Phosphohexomutase n=1 Tax=Orenia marismortui TaxID=46469 RepID=A0A4R8HG82_9FIRM|nr:type I phosphomannose isomerase catalytic subunit [Orenia marismortui]TDX59246.1 mannose-6-phosphate isomerase type 1 [Orenia marismortui]
MYPLKFKPIYKEKIWGGVALSNNFGRDLPSDSIGESWEIAAHQNGTSIITNGRFAGQTLMEAVKEEGDKVLGSSAKEEYYDKFPLLVKILDANAKLSVQVHPDDEYANKHENGELGKTEMWYIIDAKEDAKLIYGVKPEIEKEEFAAAIKEGRLEDNLMEITVKAGDVLYIPTGTVHAIEEGIVLAEIQQNSDTTYRVYDWNRLGKDGKPRDLHIESALNVINFGRSPREKVTGLEIREDGYVRRILVSCSYFTTETIDIIKNYRDKTDGSCFYIIMGLKGSAKLIYKNGKVDLKAGETVLLPAALGEYQIKGKCKLIKSYIINPEELKTELLEQGYNKEDINMIEGL